MRLDAVTFDFWDTLVVPRLAEGHARRAGMCHQVLAKAGHDLAVDAVTSVLADAFASYKAAWHANEQFTVVDTADYCLERWGLVGAPQLKDELMDAIAEGGVGDALELTPNIGDALRTLKTCGLRLGIICDVGTTPSAVLRRHLAAAGLLGLFDHWSFSDEVGFYKPSPLIFEHARQGLDASSPERMAHVGDLRRTDVAGARSAGWWSVRYCGVADDASDLPDADYVVKDHAELPELLAA